MNYRKVATVTGWLWIITFVTSIPARFVFYKPVIDHGSYVTGARHRCQDAHRDRGRAGTHAHHLEHRDTRSYLAHAMCRELRVCGGSRGMRSTRPSRV